MENDHTFKAFVVTEVATEATAGQKPEYTAAVTERRISDLPTGEVLIQVEWSSLNYKDALSRQGNKGVTRNYPHTPGIDAAGTVVESTVEGFRAGDKVIVTGYDLGMNTAGGFGQYIRVPAEWVVSCPENLTLRESMITGTAGITAALCIDKLLRNGLEPEQGRVLVTGASGGVGSYAVALLAQLGFTVAAVTGKPEQASLLKSLGAAEILTRDELTAANPRPLLKELWAGAVDVAGGEMLFNIVKSLQYGGSVACCGLVASPVFEASVFPFILRGVNLLGVDSVNLPNSIKAALWQKLAKDWKLKQLESLVSEIGFDQLETSLQRIYQGGASGRIILDLTA